MTSKEFSGKRILVTGVGSGIGKALSIRLAELGAEVYGVSRTQAHLDALKQQCPDINIICQDLGDWEGTKKTLQSLPVMDGLVNNAAIGDQKAFFDNTPEFLDKYVSS